MDSSTQTRELDLSGSGELVGLAAPGAAPCRLRRLRISLPQVALNFDFRTMPGLSYASLWARELTGAATLASASHLSHLRLGGARVNNQGALWEATFESALDKPWLAEALGALPNGLGVLELHGTFLGREVGGSGVAQGHGQAGVRGGFEGHVASLHPEV